MGQYFDCWYVIGASVYLCRSHIVLVSPCVSIQMFTSNASLFQSYIRTIFPPWCIHFEFFMLRYIQNWGLGPFWFFVVVRDSKCCLYAPPELALTVGQYPVNIMVLVFLFPHNSIYDQRPRFLKSWTFTIILHYTSSTAMMDLPPLWNVPP